MPDVTAFPTALADAIDALGPGARAVVVAYGGAFAAGLATICFLVLFVLAGLARDAEAPKFTMLEKERHDVE
ncbi:MAG TPA: hypothetical protein VIM86_01970 [Thermodesulfobacteriota bacterium]